MKASSEANGLKPIGKPATLALADLAPSPGNRAIPKDEDLKGLASSIKTVGLLYPIIVKLDPEKDGAYRIVAGERRWRAMKILKLENAPCVVLNEKDDESRAEVVRVVENHQRRNLEPLEEAAAVRGLLDLGMEPEAVARSLGRSRAWIARRSSLTELSDVWLQAIRAPEHRVSAWPPSHLEVVSRFPAEVQDRMLTAFGSQWLYRVPAFRDLVEQTGRFLRTLAAAPWGDDDETLVPEAGACSACPKRSSRTPDLFAGELDPDEGKSSPGDRCLDPECWRRKADAFLVRKAEDLRKRHPDLVLLDNGEGVGARFSETFRETVLQPYEVAAGRKSDGNAVPALVVDGPGMGRVKWVQPVGNGARSTRPTEEIANRDEPRPEKSPEEKRAPYDKRRRQLVVDAVKAKLETLAAEADLSKVAEVEGGAALAAKGLVVKTLALLATTLDEGGWLENVRDPLAMPEEFPWEDLDGLKNHEVGSGASREAALRLCWTLLRQVVGKLASRLAVAPGEVSNGLHYAEAETLCAMLGFDLAALKAQAAAAIPYAKLWRDLVADEWATPETEGAEEAAVGSEAP